MVSMMEETQDAPTRVLDSASARKEEQSTHATTDTQDLAQSVRAEIEARRRSDNILETHRLYDELIYEYYTRPKSVSNAIELSLEACRQQIELAPIVLRLLKENDAPLPMHKGYDVLVTLLEKQGHYDEVVEWSKRALNEGWGGDWEVRIHRCEKTNVKRKK